MSYWELSEMVSPSYSKYPYVDSLRGIAILAVIFYHYTDIFIPAHFTGYRALNPFQIGWIGVDMFFMISGFLITSILVKSKGTKGFFVNFYWRRALRIFPLYYSLLVFLFFVAPVLFESTPAFKSLETHWAFYWFHGVNFFTGYFNFFPSKLVSHLWSLSLEVQFYVIIPWIIYFTPKAKLNQVFLILIGVCNLLRFVLVAKGNMSFAIYSLLFTRMDCLLAGALLAVNKEGQQRFVPDFRVLLGCFLTYGLMVVTERGLSPFSASMQLIGFPIHCYFCYCLLAWVLDETRGKGKSFLEWKFLQKTGTCSYALFLFHQPLFWWAKVHLVGNVEVLKGFPIAQGFFLGLVVLVLGFVLAHCSTRYFEQPIRRFREGRFRYSESEPAEDRKRAA